MFTQWLLKFKANVTCRLSITQLKVLIFTCTIFSTPACVQKFKFEYSIGSRKFSSIKGELQQVKSEDWNIFNEVFLRSSLKWREIISRVLGFQFSTFCVCTLWIRWYLMQTHNMLNIESEEKIITARLRLHDADNHPSTPPHAPCCSFRMEKSNFYKV